MLKKIMIATDGSEASRKAARMGIDIVRASCPEVTAIYVVDTKRLNSLHGYTSLPGLKDRLLDMMLREGKSATSEVAKMASDDGLSSNKIVAEGDPSSELLRISRESGMDLLVIGSIGRSGLSKLLLGSVAEKVIRHSKVPVLLLPIVEA
ncbi:MAG: universal stress protein [Methanotrichaceae archaeon]